MKKTAFLALITIATTSACAQTQHETSFSITYSHLHQDVEEMPKLSESIYVLDVADGKSHFYNKDFERGLDISDSLSKKGYSAMDILEFKKKEGIRRDLTNTTVLKNYPEAGKISVIESIGNNFIYEEAMPQFDWRLEEGDTIIAGYTCHKATTSYRGRVWTAFFTPDIPVDDGPWKLCGLPGLILKAKDNEGKFIFDCIGIANNLQRPIKPRNGKMQKCDAKEMADLLKLSSKDINEFMFRITGTRLKHYDSNGQEVRNMPSLTACLKEIP